MYQGNEPEHRVEYQEDVFLLFPSTSARVPIRFRRQPPTIDLNISATPW